MVVRTLLYDLYFTFLFQIFRLYWDGEIVLIVFFDLNYDAYGHCFMSKGHLHDLMEKRA